jgi:exonuclease VII large subunit
MLEKIKEELDKQNKIIFQTEKERNNLEIERDDLSGLQVITKKASLQRQIDSKEAQIDRLKAGLSKTVQRHGYRNVKDFYNAYYSAQKACADYIKKVKAWENTYGEEAKTKKQSICERLDNYRKEVNERQAERIVYRSDRGAR